MEEALKMTIQAFRKLGTPLKPRTRRAVIAAFHPDKLTGKSNGPYQRSEFDCITKFIDSKFGPERRENQKL